LICSQLFTVALYDTTTEPKTAVILHRQILEVIKNLQETWQVRVMGVTTDMSGESRKAWKMLNTDFPSS
jgi:hypothetical protein